MEIKINLVKTGGTHMMVGTHVITDDRPYSRVTTATCEDPFKYKQGFELEIIESVVRHLKLIQKEILNA